MTFEAFRRNDLASSFGSEAVVSVTEAVAKAGYKWNVWAKAGLIALSAVSGLSATVITAVSAFVGYKVVKPARRVLTEDAPAIEGVSAELLPRQRINFKSADGRLNIAGFFYPHPESRAGIVLCHGFHGGAVDTHKGALYAQMSGYNALTFDFRGCGESEGKTTSVGFWEVEDLLGAVAYLKSRPEIDPHRIGVYGYSMGGAVTIMAAERDPDIRAIVTDCAFASLDTLLSVNFRHFYRLPPFPFKHTAVWWSRRFNHTIGKRCEPVEALQKMTADDRRLPHLIMHGLKDKSIPVSDAHLIYETAPGPKHLWIDPEARHVIANFEPMTSYMQRVCGFFDTILKK